VRRWCLALGLGAFAVAAAAVVGGSEIAAAADSCASINYVATLGRAGAALSATPPNGAAARALLTGVISADPGLHAVLDPVVADLDGGAAGVETARRRLDALSSTLALPPGSTCRVDSAPARGLLHDVYASPVFANLDQNTQPSFLERIGQGAMWAITHLRDALAWLFSHMAGALGVVGTIALAAVVLLALAAFAAWRLARVLGVAPARLRDEPAAEGTDPDTEWALALRAASRGDYREAIRRAFRSALLDAADRGRLRLDAAWTTRELLASISADADLLTALAPASAAFDYAWYSGHAVDGDDWERARARCQAVRAMARRRSPAPVP
jgi:hypothetical protein